MAACQVEGAIYRREDGLVIMTRSNAPAARTAWMPALTKSIYFNEDLNIAQKCTGCAHLLDSGWKEPRCADACPTQALKFREESEFKDLDKEAEIMLPELGAKPRVYYLNIPKRFIAGTVYDPVEKEVIIGATCTLTEIKAGKKYTATTDGFGDFWFEKLNVGTFSLNIKKDGKTKKIDSISTEKDVNLGDIALT